MVIRFLIDQNTVQTHKNKRVVVDTDHVYNIVMIMPPRKQTTLDGGVLKWMVPKIIQTCAPFFIIETHSDLGIPIKITIKKPTGAEGQVALCSL